MTIIINEAFFYYWALAIVFESILWYISWKKLKKDSLRYETIIIMMKTLKKTQLINPIAYIIFILFFFYVSPIIFPYSLFGIIRKLFRKKKLDKLDKLEVLE